MVNVFREVWRVLRDDGTLWVNIGDSYATNIKGSGGATSKQSTNAGSFYRTAYTMPKLDHGLKNKDMVGIPWRLAFALQDDGWYLRSDIIWHKPNPMPESVTDRPTKAHEYIFLLAKQEHYFYDAEAVREPGARYEWRESKFKCGDIQTHHRSTVGRETKDDTAGRNKRSVWTVAPSGYTGAHFATFPPALIEPCILAGTSAKGQCPACGSPWKRVFERTGHDNKREVAHVPGNCQTKTDSTGWSPVTAATDNWEPTCSCDAGDPVSQIVLDPFSGSGTTGVVCIKHQRRYVGLELNPAYIELSRQRVNGTQITMIDL